MPRRVEDPGHLSIARLKSDLVAHNVALPPSKSRKEVYVALHVKHVPQKTYDDFSSDDEERTLRAKDNKEVPDPAGLTDGDLKAALFHHGLRVGPIVASTRALYEKQLEKLFQSDGCVQHNGADNGALYSDSEDKGDRGEEEDTALDCEEEEQTVQQSDQAPQGEVSHLWQNGYFTYPQCFLLSSRLRVPARNRKPEWNSRNALRSSERSQPRCTQTSAAISRTSSKDQSSGLGSGVPSASQAHQTSGCSSSFSITQMVEEMENRSSLSSPKDSERLRSEGLDSSVVDEYTRMNQSLYYTPQASHHKMKTKASQEPVEFTFKHMFPATEITPTGIYASQRRPIKGAAGRPVQYVYPDTCASPTTLERREVARRLVPVHIQLLVFLILTCFLYFIYVCMEDNSSSPFGALLQ